MQPLKVHLRSTRKLTRAPFPRLAETMHTLVLTAIAVCFLEKVTTIGAQTCYFPDGSVADHNTPCRAPSANQASACCAYSDICLDNSLCLAQSGHGVIWRGSCTDQTWQSIECARYCQDSKLNDHKCEKPEIPFLLAPFFISSTGSLDIIACARVADAHISDC